jgi:hypothetical protein
MLGIIGSKPKFREGKRGNLHNEELHSLYSSPCIIRMIKSRRMRWVRHVACITNGGEEESI